MKEPVIIYCQNGHIYDASLSEECSYCKKKNEDAERLNSMLKDGDFEIRSFEYGIDEDDKTEMLVTAGDDRTEHIEYEDDKTEMLLTDSEEDDSSDETEMLDIDSEVDDQLQRNILQKTDRAQSKNKNDFSRKIENKLIQGWLVCINGPNKGSCINLYTINQFYSNSNGIFALGAGRSFNPLKKEYAFGINREGNGAFVMEANRNEECFIDGIKLTTVHRLYPYAHIRIRSIEYVFVPLVGTQFEWEG